MLDLDNNPCSFLFELPPDGSSITIGLDVGKHPSRNCITDEPFITILRPTDVAARTFSIYVAHNHAIDASQCLRVQLAGMMTNCIASLVSANLLLLSKSRRQPKVFAKWIHGITHTPPDQINSICQQAGILNRKIARAIDEVSESC